MFHIHTIASSPTASVDDFYFAGETQSLNNGTTSKSFGNIVGFIMKSKINSADETCFSLPTGYSIDMSVLTSIFYVASSFLHWDNSNNWGSGNGWWNNLHFASSITLTSSSYNEISYKSTASTKYQTFCDAHCYYL